MTYGEAEAFVNRYVRLVHAGPEYVQQHDPEGLVVRVTESQLYLIDPRRPLEEPRAWQLASICEARPVRDRDVRAQKKRAS